MKLSICTPTYNRCSYLPKIYESLKNQTSNDFEWIIVDDGSTDDTFDYVQSIINENEIRIIYLKTDNGGKHRAVNKGIELARYPWFMILDSDDYLTENAIEEYLKNIKEIDNSDIKGLVCLRTNKDGVVIGDVFPSDFYDSDFIERHERNIQGDKCEIICTQLMKDTKFPEFEGEKFLAESGLWIKISEGNKFRFINIGGYVCNYQVGGLTENSLKNRYKNPKGSTYVYNLQFNNYKKSVFKIKSAINFWRFFDGDRIFDTYPNRLFYPLGRILRYYDTNWRV